MTGQERIMQKYREYGLDAIPFTTTQGATGIAMIRLADDVPLPFDSEKLRPCSKQRNLAR